MGFGKDGKGAIVKEQTVMGVGALAAQDAVGVDSLVLLDMDFRILKTELTATLTGITSLEGAGLILYMSQGILSVAESEVNIEQNGPVRLGEKIEEEVASRWVRRVGTSTNNRVNITESMLVNKYGGHLLEINPRWTFRRGRTAAEGGWNWVLYNNGATLTTGASLRIIATHYGVWVA